AAEAGVNRFAYFGPNDSRTRPWCADRVGALFTRAQIDEVPSDVGPQPPSLYGGGYGCRHAWVPVPEEQAGDFPRWRR
ncbi:MAG: hypothetical protein Q8S13_03335, partial [Dehalococcoidia bacterium]|nr:hypothetical protein [Dehalococcoidia bacterium]